MSKKKTQKEFEREVCELYGTEYTVNGKYINNRTCIKVKHNICNYIWSVRPDKFLDGRLCPFCKQSAPEKIICSLLNKMHIDFDIQYKIKDCKNISPLPFDFAVFDKEGNLRFLIEYQGEQHYSYAKHFHKCNEGFIDYILCDSEKRAYCEFNNIPLLEISYKEFDNIEHILKENLIKYSLKESEVNL